MVKYTMGCAACGILGICDRDDGDGRALTGEISVVREAATGRRAALSRPRQAAGSLPSALPPPPGGGGGLLQAQTCSHDQRAGQRRPPFSRQNGSHVRESGTALDVQRAGKFPHIFHTF